MPELKTIQERESNISEYTKNWEQDEKLGIYAVANEFARLPQKMSVQAFKALGVILSKIDYTKDNRNENGEVIVSCTLAEIRKACGVSKKDTNYEYYKTIISNLINSSYVEGDIDGRDVMGYVIPWVEADHKAEQITFEFTLLNKLLPYFQCLYRNYTKIEIEQTKNFKSKFSMALYLNLLSWTNGENESYRFYTTKQLKEMFGLSKDDYCKKDGKFNRTEFEKKTIEVAIKEINQNTRMKVEYKKNKKNNRVANYQFNFIEVI